jgi:hypothetical protein
MTKRSTLSQVRRSSYLLSRTIGDYQAAQRGGLGKRLVRRSLMRTLFRSLR